MALAREGASIIAFDICAPVATAPYPMASESDLAETVRLVEEAGGKILARQADVRDLDRLTAIVDEGIDQFGRLDIILGNAGIVSQGLMSEMTAAQWGEMIDINLTGVFNTVRAGMKQMISAGNGGAIVLTSSTAGLRSMDNIGHYVAAKHGVTGLAKALANELGQHNIRVNSLHPSNVRTDMLVNEGNFRMFRPDLDNPQLEDAIEAYGTIHLLDTPWLEPEDVSSAVLYLVSSEGRFITGSQFTIDAGFLAK
ncbi:mycofactocin-coupled SDR family oxidoreductase [Gordonia sp. CPCC 205515]|uniref:mycofactocin-coupled SDR family oxidoreductase n=1 Tax=Gordonia sp. CPCC 205515 TaxID=3140791 RepID=UPI003AF3E8A4